MKIKIESKKPIPPREFGGRAECYPFASMKKGDSFAVNGGDPERAQNNLSNCANYYTKRHNPKARFTTRQTKDGARIWRTA